MQLAALNLKRKHLLSPIYEAFCSNAHCLLYSAFNIIAFADGGVVVEDAMQWKCLAGCGCYVYSC